MESKKLLDQLFNAIIRTPWSTRIDRSSRAKSAKLRGTRYTREDKSTSKAQRLMANRSRRINRHRKGKRKRKK